MHRSLRAVATTALLAVVPLAVSAAGDGEIRRFPYGGATPTVSCVPYFVCDVSLEPGESVRNVAVGDSLRWLVASAASGANGAEPHILIKPTEANLRTNLVVTTDRRAYFLNLRSIDGAPMLHVGFTYTPSFSRPASVVVAATPAPAPTTVAPAPVATPAPVLDFGYTIGGARKIAPAHAYNDGKHTYLTYDAQLPQMPALLAIGPTGDELVNYRVVDSVTYVADGVPNGLVLVLGGGRGQQRAEIRRREAK